MATDSLQEHFFNTMTPKEREKHLETKKQDLEYAKDRVKRLEVHIAQWEEWLKEDRPVDHDGVWP